MLHCLHIRVKTGLDHMGHPGQSHSDYWSDLDFAQTVQLDYIGCLVHPLNYTAVINYFK